MLDNLLLYWCHFLGVNYQDAKPFCRGMSFGNLQIILINYVIMVPSHFIRIFPEFFFILNQLNPNLIMLTVTMLYVLAWFDVKHSSQLRTTADADARCIKCFHNQYASSCGGHVYSKHGHQHFLGYLSGNKGAPAKQWMSIIEPCCLCGECVTLQTLLQYYKESTNTVTAALIKSLI